MYFALFRDTYAAEQFKMDVGNFIPEFSVTGVLWSAASVTVSVAEISDTFCHRVGRGGSPINCGAMGEVLVQTKG
jgi:hypothetical protein